MRLALFTLVFAPMLAWACSDPAKHQEHLLREMQTAEAQRTGQAKQSAPPPSTSSLESSEKFFGSVGRTSGEDGSSRRRR